MRKKVVGLLLVLMFLFSSGLLVSASAYVSNDDGVQFGVLWSGNPYRIPEGGTPPIWIPPCYPIPEPE